jgi:hypothetical protein
VPPIDGGFSVVDTPGWEHDATAVSALIAAADVVVVVVSATRYADESVASLWRVLDRSRTELILNRVAVHGLDRAELLASAADAFGREPYIIDEGELLPDGLIEHVGKAIPTERTDVMRSIMTRTASAGARFVVRAVLNAAPDIGKVRLAVDGLSDSARDHGPHDVEASWSDTRDGMVEHTAREIRERDDDVVRRSGTGLASRILADIGPWDETVLASDLDDWWQGCIATYRAQASIRWRRAGAQQLIERFSWKSAISSDVVTPKRFSRIMGVRLVEAAQASRSDLEALLSASVQTRTTTWIDALEQLGGFQPGDLLAAADGLIEHQGADG